MVQLLQNLQTLHSCLNPARIEAVWHSLQSKRKKSGDSEGKEKDAKKKNKGNEGGSRKPEEPSKDKEGDESKSGEEEAGHKEEEQDGDSQGEEEPGVDEESADKHQVHSYIADWLRCLSLRLHHSPPLCRICCFCAQPDVLLLFCIAALRGTQQ